MSVEQPEQPRKLAPEVIEKDSVTMEYELLWTLCEIIEKRIGKLNERQAVEDKIKERIDLLKEKYNNLSIPTPRLCFLLLGMPIPEDFKNNDFDFPGLELQEYILNKL
jgi:hypothetical protein